MKTFIEFMQIKKKIEDMNPIELLASMQDAPLATPEEREENMRVAGKYLGLKLPGNRTPTIEELVDAMMKKSRPAS